MTDMEAVEVALAEIDAEIMEAEQRLADLRAERVGAVAFLARIRRARATTPSLSPSSAEEPRPVSDTRAQSSRGNLALVEEILRLFDGRAVELAAIQAESARRGRDLNNEQVRSAVSYLKRKGISERVGRGRWKLVRPAADQDPESTDSTGLSATVTARPDEGGDEIGTGENGDHHPDEGVRDHGGSAPTLARGG